MAVYRRFRFSSAPGRVEEERRIVRRSLRRREPLQVGERFLGTVVKTTPFGAFVSLLPGKDGLVHISKLGGGKRIGKVEDVVNVGDKLQVEITDIDARGKISLVPVAEGDGAPAAGDSAPAEAAVSAGE